MKQDWVIETLGNVSEVLDSLRKPITKKDRIEGEYPYYWATGVLSYINDYLFSEKLVLIGEDGAKWLSGDNTSFIVNGKYWVNNHAHVIRPNRGIILDEWIVYFLNFSDLTPFITGMTVPKLNQQKMRSISIPLPPLQEQQRIVSILDEAFANIAKAKANAEQNLKNAKELFESYLQGVFENKGEEWEERKLKEICAKITDWTHQTPKYFDEGVIFLSSKNVTSRKIDWDNIKYIDEKQHIEMHKRVAPKVGDILLAKNWTTGVAAMVDKDVVFDIYVSLAHIRVLEKVSPKFMLYFINSPFAKKQFNKRLKGSGVPNLHLVEIREVVIPFPKSIKEQESILKKLDSLSLETKKLESIYQKKINDLEELKKSILQKAFNWEL